MLSIWTLKPRKTSFGIELIVGEEKIDIDYLERQLSLGLSPFYINDSYIDRPYGGKALTLPDSNKNTYNRNCPEILVIEDYNSFIEVLDSLVIHTELSNLYKLNETFKASLSSEDKTKYIKSMLEKVGKSLEEYIVDRNTAKEKDLLGNIPPYKIYTTEEFYTRFEIVDDICCERSTRWNVTNYSGNIHLLRNEDKFMIVPTGKILTMSEFLSILNESPKFETSPFSKLCEGHIQIYSNKIVPGKLLLLEPFNITSEFINYLMKKYNLGNSSLRKHEQFNLLTEFYLENPKALPALPKCWQLSVSTAKDSSKKEPSMEDQERHLIILLKTIFQAGSSMGIGSTDMPVVGERVSPDGSYNTSILSYNSEEDSVREISWISMFSKAKAGRKGIL